MLLGHPERILAGHEIPAHGSLTRGVRTSVVHLQRLQGLTPSALRMVQSPEGLAGLHEEDVVVIDLPGDLQGFSKTEMPSQNGQRAGTQLNAAIFARLRFIPIDAGDSRFADADYSLDEVDVRKHEGDLLRRSQAGEKAKLIVVALCFTPIVMDSSDECLGIVHGERINLRAVRFAKTGTPKVQGWVFMDRTVSVSKLEGTLQDADGVVVCFFTPTMAVCDGYQTRVSDL